MSGGKLIAGPTCGRVAGCGFDDALGAGGIVEIEENVGLELRYLVNKDAVGIFLLESLQQGFGLGFLVGFVIGPGGEKVGVVGKQLRRLSLPGEDRQRVGIALIEQVSVAQRQVGGGRGFAGM